MAIAEFIAGAAITIAILLDVMGTVVVPGRMRPSIGLPRRIRWAFLPTWRQIGRLAGRPHPRRLPSSFAGFLLLILFVAWVATLLLGLSLMMHALRQSFQPRLSSFADTLFQTGSAMMTLGLNGVRPIGWSRFIVVVAGVSGLQVVTLTLTYIVQLQMALHSRDPLVLRLETVAGAPPSAVQVLLTQKTLGLDGELAALFDRWEGWAADVQQTHRAHPILAYFRSEEPSADWVTALGVILDTAVLVKTMLPDAPKGHAELLLSGGTRAARSLCTLLRLQPLPCEPVSAAGFLQAAALLRGAGYPIADPDAARPRIDALRAGYAGAVAALANHFGVPVSNLWVPEGGEGLPAAGRSD